MPPGGFVILGNPENRRIALFQAALQTQGFEPAIVVPWLDFLQDPHVLEKIDLEECWFRIDSAGENFEVERALLLLGAEKGMTQEVAWLSPSAIARLTNDRGQILAPRQAHLGFELALKKINRVLKKRPGWRALNPVPDILELFDKRRTSARYSAKGIPVPESLGHIETIGQLEAQMHAMNVPAVFVKLSCGSSASCLGLYQREGAVFHPTIEQARTGWYRA